MRTVTVLAHDLAPVVQAWVDDHPITGSDVRGLGSGAERLDDTGTVRAKNARLRHRWHPHPNPDIEMVERRGCEPDDDFAPARSRVCDVLVTENLGPALVVETHGLHDRRMLAVPS